MVATARLFLYTLDALVYLAVSMGLFCESTPIVELLSRTAVVLSRPHHAAPLLHRICFLKGAV